MIRSGLKKGKISARIMRRSSGLYVTRYVYIWVYFFRRSSQFLEDVIEVNGKWSFKTSKWQSGLQKRITKKSSISFMQPMNSYGNDMLAKR